MKWYKHSCTSIYNKKILKLMTRFGADSLKAYGMYHACLELVGMNLEPENVSCKLEWDASLIAGHFHMAQEEVEKLLDACVEEKLIEKRKGIYYAEKIMERLDNTMSQNPNIKKISSNFKSLKAEENRIDKTRIEQKRYKDIESIYFRLFEDKFGEAPGYSYATGRKVLRQYMKQYGDEKVKDLIEVWFTSGIGDWNGYSITSFHKDINKCLGVLSEGKSIKDMAAKKKEAQERYKKDLQEEQQKAWAAQK